MDTLEQNETHDNTQSIQSEDKSSNRTQLLSLDVSASRDPCVVSPLSPSLPSVAALTLQSSPDDDQDCMEEKQTSEPKRSLSADSTSSGSLSELDSCVLSAEETPETSPSSSKKPNRSSSTQLVEQAVMIKKRAGVFFQSLVNDWGPRNATSPTHSESGSEGLRREKRLSECKKEWANILSKWSSVSQRKKENLCWPGIPPSIRGAAWKAIIGNDLKITPDLYSILSARAKETALAVRTGSNNSASRENSMSIIEIDVPRTFPQLKFFHGDGPLHTPLLNLLRTYVMFRPDIGYIQGMSYIAAILLLNLDSEVDAFIALANLFNRELYFRLFRDFSSGEVPLRVFDRMLRRHVPRIAAQFSEMGIEPSMYLYDWIVTMFSRSFPLDVTCRIWDNFLISGSVFLFRSSLGIIKLYSKALSQSSFEQCLHLLNHVPENIDLAVDEYFDCISSINISSKQFKAEIDFEKQKGLTSTATG